jgi:hypothetical protein
LTTALSPHAGSARMGCLTAIGVLPNLLFALNIGALVDRRGHVRWLFAVAYT